jgi:hypothetical protein
MSKGKIPVLPLFEGIGDRPEKSKKFLVRTGLAIQERIVT